MFSGNEQQKVYLNMMTNNDSAKRLTFGGMCQWPGSPRHCCFIFCFEFVLNFVSSSLF